MSNRDDVAALYKKSNKLNFFCQVFFWANGVFAIFSLFWDGILNNISGLMQIITFILYMTLKSIDNGHFWYNAESMRRKDNMQVGLGIDLSDFETDGYYDNSLEPSVIKYGMNTFESVFFSKELVTKMYLIGKIKAIFSFIILIIAGWFYINHGVFLVVVQAFFSYFIVDEMFTLERYGSKLEKIYDVFYAEFVTVGITRKNQQILLLHYVMEYEMLKSYHKVRINTSLFKKNNDELSSRWGDIKAKCKIREKLL